MKNSPIINDIQLRIILEKYCEETYGIGDYKIEYVSGSGFLISSEGFSFKPILSEPEAKDLIEKKLGITTDEINFSIVAKGKFQAELVEPKRKELGL